jgi:hypothetical protein
MSHKHYKQSLWSQSAHQFVHAFRLVPRLVSLSLCNVPHSESFTTSRLLHPRHHSPPTVDLLRVKLSDSSRTDVVVVVVALDLDAFPPQFPTKPSFISVKIAFASRTFRMPRQSKYCAHQIRFICALIAFDSVVYFCCVCAFRSIQISFVSSLPVTQSSVHLIYVHLSVLCFACSNISVHVSFVWITSGRYYILFLHLCPFAFSFSLFRSSSALVLALSSLIIFTSFFTSVRLLLSSLASPFVTSSAHCFNLYSNLKLI